jgi:hypothetical protein
MQPSTTLDTTSPELPKRRYSIDAPHRDQPLGGAEQLAVDASRRW